MKKKLKIILSYLLISFNTFVFAVEKNDEGSLKIGVLLPLTGELKSLGEDMLYAINLALHDINDEIIKIYPKDSGSNKEEIISACKEFQDEGIKIVIGPIDSAFKNELKRFDDLIFLSLSNMSSVIEKNIVMMGINLESQLLAIKKFIDKMLQFGIQLGDAYNPPCHKQPVFEKYVSGYEFEVADEVLQKHISLPMYTELTDENIVFITDKIKEVLNDYRE